MAALRALRLAVAAALAAGQSTWDGEGPGPNAPTIYDITFQQGSPLGSQRLALRGSGYTTNFHAGSNTVELGSDEQGWTTCVVVEGACTVDCGSASRIVCDTEPFSPALGGIEDVWAAGLQVRVKVCRSACDSWEPDIAEAWAPMSFDFTPARNSPTNPTLLGVFPRQLSAEGALALTGSRFGTSLADFRVVYVGQGPPPRGGNVDTGVSRLHAVCRPQMLNYASRPAEEGGQGERRRHVSAEDNPPLPITEDYYRCELGDFEAGSYNVSVQLPQGLAWASPEDAGLYSRDSAGTKYQVQYFPTVSGISPAQGSLGGGTTVTISGRGFSTDEHDVMIDLGSTQVWAHEPASVVSR